MIGSPRMRRKLLSIDAYEKITKARNQDPELWQRMKDEAENERHYTKEIEDE